MKQNGETGKITLSPDGGVPKDFYAIEQTVIGGAVYLLVSDTAEGDGEALILRDDSSAEDAEALYTIVEDEAELRAAGDVFRNILAEDGISLD